MVAEKRYHYANAAAAKRKKAAEKGARGNTFPRLVSLVRFFARRKEMNINSLTSARCARLSVGELRSFCLLMPIRPQRAPGEETSICVAAQHSIYLPAANSIYAAARHSICSPTANEIFFSKPTLKNAFRHFAHPIRVQIVNFLRRIRDIFENSLAKPAEVCYTMLAHNVQLWVLDLSKIMCK